MNQSQFERSYQDQWTELGLVLDLLESKPKKTNNTDKSLGDFPEQYRRLCNHYGLARARHYSPALVDRLHDLVLRGHRQLYKKKNRLLWVALNFIARDFPQTLRRYQVFFWAAFILFYGPAITVGIATYNNPALIYSLMEERQVAAMESMYNPENAKIGPSSKRASETDLVMFGYYILNNISIGFRTFAGGIVFGVGTLFLLVFNGLMIGGVAGHLSHPPYDQTFWQFVAGHGPFELTAIVISGGAGLLLGLSLLRPGQYRRTDSLRRIAPTALVLVMGAALMLVLAAFIEAFWSSSSLSPTVKFSVAGFNWLLVILYLCIGGRRRDGS